MILVDDSIVRGTTSEKIVAMVRAAGSFEVHMRISSPPTRNSCFYGIDTPEQEHLLASAWTLPAWPTTSLPTAWPLSPWTAYIAPSGKPHGMMRHRNIVMPVSLVTTPLNSLTKMAGLGPRNCPSDGVVMIDNAKPLQDRTPL